MTRPISIIALCRHLVRLVVVLATTLTPAIAAPNESCVRAQFESCLRVQFVLRDGFFAAEELTSNFEPSNEFKALYRGSVAAGKKELIESLNAALRSQPRAIQLSRRPDVEAAIGANGARPTSIDSVLHATANWEDAKQLFADWARQNGVMGEQEITEYLVTLLTEITGNLNESPSPLDNTPFLSSEVGTSFEELERLSKGQVDLAVADPISESDLDGRMFVFRANAGALTDIGVTQELLGRALRPLVGELWLQTRIQRQVGDILADVGLQSYHLALSPPSLQTNPSTADANQTASPFHYVQVRRSETLSRQVEIVGPPKFSAIQLVVPHDDTTTQMKLLYLLLPDEDYRRVRANNDLLLKTKGQVDTGNPVEFEILDLRMTPASSLIIANGHVNHRVLRERLGSIQQIGYQAIISRDRDTGDSQTTWARLVVLPLPETTTPQPTPSGAMGPNAISPDRIAAAPAERNHLRLAVGVDTTETTTVLVEYSRDDIAGDDNLSVRAGWRGEMIIGGTYQKDFAAFGFLGRRLTISASGDSDFHPDRLIDNERHDERRNGGSASALLELFRDRQDHWLQFQTSLSRQDVKLKQNPTVPDKDTISRATLGLSYAWLRPYVIGTPLLTIDPSFSVARSDTNDSDFLETSVRAAFHARFANFFEFDSRLGFDWASAETPEIELPRFGGEESVRGFRLEAASARLAWSLQNEVWFPLRFTDLLGSTMDGLLRRSLKLAAFIDIGGVEDSQQPVSAFEAGAGLGLRFTLQDQATLRIDWAHPLTDFASDLGGHTFYFSILLQPAHF